MKCHFKLAGGALFAAALLGSAVADAALVVNPGGLTVTDTDTGLMWVQDPGLAASNTFGVGGIGSSPADNMDWNTAQAWIAAMNAASYAGFSDWRLPECTATGCAQNEMKTLWEGSLGNTAASEWGSGDSGPFVNPINYGGHSMWTGTSFGSTDAWLYLPGSGEWTDPKNSAYGIGAWAVRATAVPAPAAVWLLGSALAGMGIIGRRRQPA